MFQQFVLSVAIVVLIIMLIIVGIILSKGSANNGQWPPVVSDCPDYWTDVKGNGSGCVNTHSLGKCNLPTKEKDNSMDFDTSPFNTTSGTCEKYKWATNCGITWDGITTGIQNPCSSTNK